MAQIEALELADNFEANAPAEAGTGVLCHDLCLSPCRPNSGAALKMHRIFGDIAWSALLGNNPSTLAIASLVLTYDRP